MGDYWTGLRGMNGEIILQEGKPTLEYKLPGPAVHADTLPVRQEQDLLTPQMSPRVGERSVPRTPESYTSVVYIQVPQMPNKMPKMPRSQGPPNLSAERVC